MGVSRLYIYNDFTRPIDPSPFEARVDAGATLELSEEGDFLVASVPAPSSPQSEVVLHVRFPEDDGGERRFDFIFPDSMLVDEEGRRSADATSDANAAAVADALPEFLIPEEPLAIVEEILERDERIRELIGKGLWPDLYIPALEAKDLVLALRKRDPERSRVAAKGLIRAAWLLDVYGDMGNRLEVERSYELFRKAIGQLEASYAK